MNGRTPAQLRRHYEAEKAIADRLRAADADQRRTLYRSMYDELRAAIPDDPRWTAAPDPAAAARAVRRQRALLGGYLRPDATVVEFGPGDCRFAVSLCDRVRKVVGVDVADHRPADLPRPENFRLVLYDGFEAPLPDACADVVFSDQLIEHLHPDDTAGHFRLAHRLLRAGGAYVFRTPHAFCGPHDVSRYFCDRPQGFHLKEWTVGELAAAVKAAGFRRVRAYSFRAGVRLPWPVVCLRLGEAVLGVLPRRMRRMLGRVLLPSITMAAVK